MVAVESDYNLVQLQLTYIWLWDTENNISIISMTKSAGEFFSIL